jgi:hypothetical protein
MVYLSYSYREAYEPVVLDKGQAKQEKQNINMYERKRLQQPSSGMPISQF